MTLSTTTNELEEMGWTKGRKSYLALCERTAASHDGRYILEFGECGIDRHTTDIITVYDTEMECFWRSSVKCPAAFVGVNLKCNVVNIGDTLQDEKAVFGFVRESFGAPKMQNVQKLPIHVIAMMSKWYCNERVFMSEKCLFP